MLFLLCNVTKQSKEVQWKRKRKMYFLNIAVDKKKKKMIQRDIVSLKAYVSIHLVFVVFS